MLSAITNAECRSYVKFRGRPGGARADLEVLRAAIRHHAKENLHVGTVHVTLPPKGAPRDRWLTRAEAARSFGPVGDTAKTRLFTVGAAKARWSKPTSTLFAI